MKVNERGKVKAKRQGEGRGKDAKGNVTMHRKKHGIAPDGRVQEEELGGRKGRSPPAFATMFCKKEPHGQRSVGSQGVWDRGRGTKGAQSGRRTRIREPGGHSTGIGGPRVVRLFKEDVGSLTADSTDMSALELGSLEEPRELRRGRRPPRRVRRGSKGEVPSSVVPSRPVDRAYGEWRRRLQPRRNSPRFDPCWLRRGGELDHPGHLRDAGARRAVQYDVVGENIVERRPQRRAQWGTVLRRNDSDGASAAR